MIRTPDIPNMTVRPASRLDHAVMESIDPRLAADTQRTRHVAELLDLGESWIAEADCAPAGYVLVSRHFFGRPFVELLMVSASWRRRGVGAALLARCEAAHEDDRLFASTNQSNFPMRALLAKAGYEASGVVHNLDPGDPELVFVKIRPPA